MPMACNQWTIDVHDQLLSKFYKQLMERHATAVLRLPRKLWVNEAVSKLLQAHAEARRSYRSALSSLRSARLRVSFFWRGLFAPGRGPVRCALFPVAAVPHASLGLFLASLASTLLSLTHYCAGHSRGRSLHGRQSCCNIAPVRLKPNASWLIKIGFRPVLMSSLQKLQRRTQHQCGTLLRD